jgi:hypothetical protein
MLNVFLVTTPGGFIWFESYKCKRCLQIVWSKKSTQLQLEHSEQLHSLSKLSLNDRDGCDNFRVYFASFVSLQDIITRLLEASLSFFVGMTKFCTPSFF